LIEGDSESPKKSIDLKPICNSRAAILLDAGVRPPAMVVITVVVAKPPGDTLRIAVVDGSHPFIIADLRKSLFQSSNRGVMTENALSTAG